MVNDATRFRVGTVLEYEGEIWTVAHSAGELDPPTVALTSDRGGYREIPLLTALRLHREYIADPEDHSHSPDNLDDLTASAREKAIDRARHIREILNGDPDGPFSEDSDPNYDPFTTTEAQRLTRKVAELKGQPGYSRAQIFRMRKEFVESGRSTRALAPYDSSVEPPDPRDGIDEDTLVEIYAKLRQLAREKATFTLHALNAKVVAHLQDAGLDVNTIAPYRLDRVVSAIATDFALLKTAKHRRSMNSRSQTGYRAPAPSMPGERIEVDCTRANVRVICPDTGHAFRPWLIVAICVLTKLLTIRVTKAKPSSKDVRLLLFDMLHPLTSNDGYREDLIPVGVPATLSIIPAPQGFGVVVADHGSEFENYKLIDCVARWGGAIEFARTGTGSDKPYVESVNRTVSLMQQDLAGYTGHSAEHAGTGDEELLTLRAFKNVVRQWTIKWQTRQHDGLPVAKGKVQCPAQRYWACIRRGAGPRVNIHPDDIYALLDSAEYALSSDGVHIGPFRYDTTVFNDLRNRLATAGGRYSNRLRIYSDPADLSRVFFRDDWDGRWHPAHAIHEDGTTFPPFSDVTADGFSSALSMNRRTRGERITADIAYYRYAEQCRIEDAELYARDRAKILDALADPTGTPGSTPPSAITPPAPCPVSVGPFIIDDQSDAEMDTDLW